MIKKHCPFKRQCFLLYAGGRSVKKEILCADDEIFIVFESDHILSVFQISPDNFADFLFLTVSDLFGIGFTEEINDQFFHIGLRVIFNGFPETVKKRDVEIGFLLDLS